MTSPSRRRASLLLATVLGVSAAALTTPVVVQADTGPMAYSCTAPGIGSQDLNFELGTNAPQKMYVGRSFTPSLTVRTVIPGWVIGLAKVANVHYADATGEITVKVNGKDVVGHAVFPYTKLPTDGKDFPVNLPVTLPTLTATKAGTVRYTPGPIHAALTGYDDHANKEDATVIGTVDANCAVKTTGKVIDTVTFVRSATATTGAVVHAKAAKKVTATAKVVARSGVVPTGRVRMVLFKGKKRVAAKTVTLAGGRATTTFAPVRAKGRYKVVTTYGGNAATTGSTVTRSFRVR